MSNSIAKDAAKLTTMKILTLIISKLFATQFHPENSLNYGL